MSRVRNILTELLDLTKEEQTQILASLNSLAPEAGEASAAPIEDKNVREVWSVVAETAKQAGYNLPPAAVAVRHKLYPTIAKGCKAVVEFVDAHFPKASKVEREAAIQLCVESVLRQFREKLRRVPVGIKTVSQQLLRVAEAVDAQLPGYRVSGLLPLAIKGMKRQKRNLQTA